MKLKNKTSTIFSLLILLLSHNLVLGQQRGKELFNDGWQFVKTDMQEFEAIKIASNIDWREVNLPHDWSIEGPFSPEWASGTGFLPGGIGWYKKKFDLLDYDDSKQYTIYFDGVYKNSEVWINGHFLGKRPNGFISFFYDLSPFLKKEGNELWVKADHRDFADSRYYTGSGIYRNVYLITQSSQYIKPWGVFFSSPKANADQAKVKVEIETYNGASEEKPILLKSRILDKEGVEVAKSETEIVIAAEDTNYEVLSMVINDPNLWSPSKPYLYDLEVSLWSGEEAIDIWKDKVGLREIRFDANNGFFLNGQNMLLKGVCIHHDAGALGAAVPKDIWAKRLETLKELGCNAIRMSHYPHQDYIYELCDEMGFLVQDEAFDEWEVGKNKWIEGWNVGKPGNDGYHEAFSEWGEKDVQDMVLRARNHPSIIMWSIGNEVDYPNDPYSHPVLNEGRNPQIYGRGYQKGNPKASRLGELAKGLVAAVKEVDTSRPVTAALAGVTMSNHTSYPSSLDIVGYNYQEYRYKEDHERYPNRIIYGSENGDALEAWLAVEENEFISSQFLWTAFDFVGEARPWPSRSSGAGIIDMAGYPKPDFYFRKSLWNPEPMVYLGFTNSEENVNRRRNIQTSWSGVQGEEKWVVCYSNVEEVELFLNGKSLGRKPMQYDSKEMPAWKVAFSEGEIKATGYIQGKEVAVFSLNTPGKLSHLAVELDKENFNSSNQQEIIHLDMALVDDNGNLVEADDKEIAIEVLGSAKLIGLESGDLKSHEDYQSNKRFTYKGKLRAYIQNKAGNEDVQIKVSGKGIPTQFIRIPKRN